MNQQEIPIKFMRMTRYGQLEVEQKIQLTNYPQSNDIDIYHLVKGYTHVVL